VTISIAKTHVVEVARTPNGKAFRIENDRLDPNKWYLDHEEAILTSKEPEPCYKNAEVEICL
jgi:hypothetical protein